MADHWHDLSGTELRQRVVAAMKALTLHQPWATLVALGVKPVETRGWATKYRGPLVIHAAKAERPEEAAIVALPDFHDALWPGLGFSSRPMPATVRHRLPRGAVVATAQLVDCVQVVEADDPYEVERPIAMVVNRDRTRLWHKVGDTVADFTDQLPYGDYTPGCYAWLLDRIEPLVEPVPAKGKQGLWEWVA